MTDQFPKNRGGWSGPGRTAAYTLAGSGDDQLTWGRKKRFGAEARNKGGHLTVKKTAVATVLDGWYSLGREGGVTVIRGSNNARDFTLRGPVPASTSNVPQIIPRGDGSAFALSSFVSVGDVSSVFGNDNPARDVVSYITRDGQSVVNRPPIRIVRGYDGVSYTAGAVLPVPGARFNGKYEHAIAYTTVAPDGQHAIGVTFDDGENQREVIAAKTDGHLVDLLGFNRIGPGTFIGMGGYVLRRSGRPSWYVPSTAEGFFFFVSTDGGYTWSRIASADIVSAENVALATLAAGEFFYGTYNEATILANMSATPLSRTRALVYIIVGRPEPNPDIPTDPYANSRVMYGVADLEAGTVTLNGTLFENGYSASASNYIRYQRSYWRWAWGTMIAPGGGVLLFFNDNNYSANWTATNLRVYYTTDGSLTLLGSPPFQVGRMGIWQAVSATKLFSPIYDGEHSLYESSDRGMTWTKRATISTLATEIFPGTSMIPPAPLSYGALVWLRDNNGLPQNATPGAPWLSDDRITPP